MNPQKKISQFISIKVLRKRIYVGVIEIFRAKLNNSFKFVIDYTASLVGLIILSPLFLMIAFLIKMTSVGPVFFKQKRLGKNGVEFDILKFRTMIVNAEKVGTGLYVKTGNDDRITKVGKLLRFSSLDELPQLINVFRGEMSLVGPRPPVPYHPYKYEEYDDFQKRRFKMKPGITGLAQIKFRNSVPWEERILIDVQYVENFNIWLDIKILFKTLFKLFKPDSIYLK